MQKTLPQHNLSDEEAGKLSLLPRRDLHCPYLSSPRNSSSVRYLSSLPSSESHSQARNNDKRPINGM